MKKLRFYNDYSVLWKDRHGGSDSKMNTLGVQVFAMPVMLWVDLTGAERQPVGRRRKRHRLDRHPVPGSNKWYFRTNVNIGYYF